MRYNEQEKDGAHNGDQTAAAPDHVGTGNPNDMAPADLTSRGKFAAFQFYPADFIASPKVARMSLTEVGIYFTLLCYGWLDQGIPCDLDQVARLVRMPSKRFRKVWAGPLSECFVKKGEKLVNPRQERQRKELIAYVASCRRGGEESAKTRRGRYGSAQPPKSPRSEPRSDAEVTPNTMSLSSSLSLSSTAEGKKEIARAPGARVGLLKPPRPEAAFDGGRVWVLHRTHQDFLSLRNGNERELLDWYAVIADDWSRGAHAMDEPGANMFKFWEARYAEKWPAAVTMSASKLPAWARK